MQTALALAPPLALWATGEPGQAAKPRHAGRCMEEYLHGRMFSQFLHYLINTAALFSMVSIISMILLYNAISGSMKSLSIRFMSEFEVS